jgi:hypothetical protein
MPNWSTLCQSVGPQGEQQNVLLPGGWYYIGTAKRDDMTSIGLEPCNNDARCQKVNVTFMSFVLCALTYNLALVLFLAFIRMGSILVAFITSPLTFNFPLMYSFCAFALPEMSLEN